MGLAVSAGASLVNLAVAVILCRAGRRHRSITLEANSQHLLTDVWTSVESWRASRSRSPAGNRSIRWSRWPSRRTSWSGVKLLRRSVDGLWTPRFPHEVVALRAVLDRSLRRDPVPRPAHPRIDRAGSSVPCPGPGVWSVQRGHALCERIEPRSAPPSPTDDIHASRESLDDPASWDDEALDRKSATPPGDVSHRWIRARPTSASVARDGEATQDDIEALDDILDAEGPSVDVLILRGQLIQLVDGDDPEALDEAFACFKEAVELDPNSADAFWVIRLNS